MIRHWIQLAALLEADIFVVRQMMRVLDSDTRFEPEKAEQEIAALKDQIPDDFRHAPSILWRSAGIAMEDAKRLLAGTQRPQLS